MIPLKRWLPLLAAGFVACGTPFGIYHEVRPGQTVYRIARTYGVDVDKLMRLNRIDDPTRIQPGDRLFVPGADRPREVPTSAGADGPPPTRSAKALSRTDADRPRSPSGAETARLRDAAPAKAARAASTGGDKNTPPSLHWPVEGSISDPFGKRSGRVHDGIDISAPRGTEIRAAADGRVIYSDDELSGYGNLVIIRHEGCWATVYAHNDVNLVAKGDFVAQGQLIAKVGSTGRASGPHLHFELRCGKTPRDPAAYLAPRTARP